MKKLTALLLALAMVLTLTVAMAANSKTTDDNAGTTTTYVTTTVVEEDSNAIYLKKIDPTAVATALLAKLAESGVAVFPADLGIAENAVVQEVMSVIPDEEAKTNAIKVTSDLSEAASVSVLLGMTAEDSEDAEITWGAAEKVEVGDDGVTLTPTYGADLAEKVKDAGTITLVVLSVPAA